MKTYATRTEAIDREIIEAIEAGDATAAEYDIQAIADAVLTDLDGGYACTVAPDEFWKIVEGHAFPTYQVDMRGYLGGVTINLADPQRKVGLLDPFTMTMQETGERIAAIRTRLGLTRADLAALLDVSWESVKNWETDKRAHKLGVWYDLLALQDRHDNEVATHVQAFQANSPRQPLLVIAEGVGAMPVGWQRTVAAEVLRKIPNLIITTPAAAAVAAPDLEPTQEPEDLEPTQEPEDLEPTQEPEGRH